MRGTPSLYYKALNKPDTVMGVDRGLFFLIIGLTLPIPYTAHFQLPMIVLALGIYVVLHGAGVLITRIDPSILAVYRRHITFSKFYVPVSTLHSKPVLRRVSVPYYQGKKGVA